MTRRNSILNALVVKLKDINGTGFTSNIYGNAYPILKFWDSCRDFPSIYSSTGTEHREYLPGDFTWAYLGISLKLYCKGENSMAELEQLLEDVESVVNANRVLVYDTTNNYETTEVLVTSITTDEGLLLPYSIGEMNLQVRYQLM